MNSILVGPSEIWYVPHYARASSLRVNCRRLSGRCGSLFYLWEAVSIFLPVRADWRRREAICWQAAGGRGVNCPRCRFGGEMSLAGLRRAFRWAAEPEPRWGTAVKHIVISHLSGLISTARRSHCWSELARFPEEFNLFSLRALYPRSLLLATHILFPFQPLSSPR